jgi:hypothetical protein
VVVVAPVVVGVEGLEVVRVDVGVVRADGRLVVDLVVVVVGQGGRRRLGGAGGCCGPCGGRVGCSGERQRSHVRRRGHGHDC